MFISNSLFAILFTLICVNGSVFANDKKEGLTPKMIVRDIIDKGTLGKSGRYVPIDQGRIKEMEHYLAPELRDSLREWVRLKEKAVDVDAGPVGQYDPLLGRKWVPEKVEIVSEKITGNKAVVQVRETLETFKIATGYNSVQSFLFTYHKGNWFLDNITTKVKSVNGETSNYDAAQNIKKDHAEFTRNYESTVRIKKDLQKERERLFN